MPVTDVSRQSVDQPHTPTAPRPRFGRRTFLISFHAFSLASNSGSKRKTSSISSLSIASFRDISNVILSPCSHTTRQAAPGQSVAAPSPGSSPRPWSSSSSSSYLLDEVQCLGHGRVVGEPALAHGEEGLDRVLHALVDHALVQDASEALEDGAQAAGRHLLHASSHHIHHASLRTTASSTLTTSSPS